MRKSRTYGSVRGTPGNRRSYRDPPLFFCQGEDLGDPRGRVGPVDLGGVSSRI
jgi:hypothetical protein